MPSYNEFLNLIERGLEFGFVFNGKKYQISSDTLWQKGSNNCQSFSSMDDVKNAKLEGKLLKNNWKNIKNLEYEC